MFKLQKRKTVSDSNKRSKGSLNKQSKRERLNNFDENK